MRNLPRYRNSRLAYRIVGAYLAFVAAATAFVAYDIAFVDHVGASFSGIYVIAATLPTSLPLLIISDGLGLPEGPLFGFVIIAASGGLNAVGLWLAIRGPRLHYNVLR